MVVILSISIVVFIPEVFVGVTKSRKSAAPERNKIKVNYDTLRSRHPIHGKPIRRNQGIIPNLKSDADSVWALSRITM